jgi:hypothetical protein
MSEDSSCGALEEGLICIRRFSSDRASIGTIGPLMSASPPGVVLKHLAGRDKYRRTRGEQETILRWDRAGDHVQVWLASPVTWRKLQRLGIPPVCETRCSGGLVSAVSTGSRSPGSGGASSGSGLGARTAFGRQERGVDESFDPSARSTGSMARVSGETRPKSSVWRPGPARDRVRLPCPTGRPGSQALGAARVP